MKLQAFYCPSCGGTVKFDTESNKSSFYCIHCGQQIIIDDEVRRTEHREIIEDKAKIQEQLAKIEAAKYEAEKVKSENKSELITYAIVGGLLAFLFLMMLVVGLLSGN